MGTTDIFNWILNSLLWGFALCLVVRFAASLMVSSTFSVVKTKNVSRHCQISPEESGGGEAKSPLVENQCMSKKKKVYLLPLQIPWQNSKLQLVLQLILWSHHSTSPPTIPYTPGKMNLLCPQVHDSITPGFRSHRAAPRISDPTCLHGHQQKMVLTYSFPNKAFIFHIKPRDQSGEQATGTQKHDPKGKQSVSWKNQMFS